MKSRYYFKLPILALSGTLLLVGCNSNNFILPNVNKNQEQNISKPNPTPSKPKGVTLNELKPSGVTNLVIKGPKEYKSGEPLRFVVDTKNRDGYLYIVYEDSKGEVGVLYPNPNSPLSQMSGRYTFPSDFGIDPKAVIATKDCGDCKKDRTVVYALLTDEPILDINKIDKTTLHNILGTTPASSNSSANSPKKAKSKGLSVNFNTTNNNSGNLNVGIFEFYVK